MSLQAREAAQRNQPLSPTEAARLLSDVGRRIEIAGRLHRLLSTENEDRVEFASFARDIAAGLVSSLAVEDRLDLTILPTDACWLDPAKALSMGLVLGELVTNAIKYAHPAGVAGTIDVRCGRTGAMAVVEVADDGVGLPEGFDWRSEGNVGLRFVRSTAEQLGGTLEFEDRGGFGLLCRLTAPLADNPGNTRPPDSRAGQSAAADSPE